MTEGVKLTGARVGATVAGVFSPDHKNPHGAKVTKVEAFGWKMIDAPGRFEMIDKVLLRVDHSYQRDTINNKRVNEIASEWSWVSCGTLTVACRPDMMNERSLQMLTTGAKTWADGVLRLILNRGSRKKLPSLFLADEGDS